MLKEIVTVLGPLQFFLACAIGFFVLLIAVSWLAYFVARSWKRGLAA